LPASIWLPRHRRDDSGDRGRRARTRPARDVRAGGAGGPRVRHTGRGVPNLGVGRDPHHRQRRHR
jgi:hypothetical protein